MLLERATWNADRLGYALLSKNSRASYAWTRSVMR